MKIAIFTVEIRAGHSPKELEALPFKLTFWGSVFMKHVLKEQPMLLIFLSVCVNEIVTKYQPMFVIFRWACINETRVERTAHVGNFCFGLCS